MTDSPWPTAAVWARLRALMPGTISDGGIMANLTGSTIEQNLKDASAGESQAKRCYLFFAKHADIEDYPEIAGLFRDTAEGEFI